MSELMLYQHRSDIITDWLFFMSPRNMATLLALHMEYRVGCRSWSPSRHEHASTVWNWGIAHERGWMHHQ